MTGYKTTLATSATVRATVIVVVTLSLVGPVSALLCFECNTIEGQCSDGRLGVKTINLIRCEGGQCAKVKVETKAFIEREGEYTERFCYEYRQYPDGCTEYEDPEMGTVTTKCYCSSDKCNGATKLSFTLVNIMGLLMVIRMVLL